VFRGECVAVILTWELAIGGVESHLKRSHVGLNENVGSDHFGGEIDALAGLGLVRGERCRLKVGAGAVGAGLLEAWVLEAAHIVPGPAVETALLDRGHIVGNKMVAQVVAVVGRAPQLTGDGIDGFTHAVADAGGVHLDELSFGSVLEDVGAMELLGGCVSGSSALDPEPTETNMYRPSWVKTTSRVQWPPPVSWA